MSTCRCVMFEHHTTARALSLVKPPEPRHAWPYSEALDVFGPAPYEGKHRADVSS